MAKCLPLERRIAIGKEFARRVASEPDRTAKAIAGELAVQHGVSPATVRLWGTKYGNHSPRVRAARECAE